MLRRKYMLQVIEHVFEKYGFAPLETPAMELLSVLTGKYGDEGDQLIFKILNSGDFTAELKQSGESLDSIDPKKLASRICEKALRYDLTVPFARYVAMNRGQLTFPFKRYQMQPVWRADRPQKGRYREFMQCDADVVGTPSLLCEAEIMCMISEVLTNLGIQDFSILINHRAILRGLATKAGLGGMESAYCTALDKLDKIGAEEVANQLHLLGITVEAAKTHLAELQAAQTLSSFKEIFNANTDLDLGIQDLEQVMQWSTSMGLASKHLRFDPTLARGLSYYTGPIFEVKVNGVQMGSISGGGRYNDLTGLFGVPDIPGVGFSFGVDRLYDVLDALGKFEEVAHRGTEVLVCAMDDISFTYGLSVAQKLRRASLKTELYPEVSKLKKQLSYANSKRIPIAIVLGSDEATAETVTIKWLDSGKQTTVALQDMIDHLQPKKV